MVEAMTKNARVKRLALGPREIRHSSFIIYHLALALLCAASAVHAADLPPQVWLISTREAPRCGDLDSALQGLCYWRLDEECRWMSAEAQDFKSTDDASVPTVVFIHGNRTDADLAVQKAWYAYEIIRQEACGRAFRFVIWSWPADRQIRPVRRDARLKAAYSDVESYYLAQWLNGLGREVRVSLVGHSFGPRIITGALHLLAGGEVAGRSLPESTVAAWREGKRNPLRAVLLAAAIDTDWLSSDGCHGLALSLVDQMLITRNGCDRVLRRYPRLCGRRGPQAMGALGPCLDYGAEKVEVVDVTGRSHDWRCYCSAPEVCRRWARYTFLEDSLDDDAPQQRSTGAAEDLGGLGHGAARGVP